MNETNLRALNVGDSVWVFDVGQVTFVLPAEFKVSQVNHIGIEVTHPGFGTRFIGWHSVPDYLFATPREAAINALPKLRKEAERHIAAVQKINDHARQLKIAYELKDNYE